MRSRLRPLAILATLMLLLVACTGTAPDEGGGGGEAAEGEGGGEMVWAIGGAEAQVGGLHQQVVELWNEENPDTPVRIEILPDQADEQRNQQALVLQGQSGEFDLLGMDVIWTGEYATNGWVASFEERRGELEEAGVLPGALESAQWEGELWAVPYNSNAGLFYYRTDLIDTPPTTWEEAVEVCTAGAQEAGIAPFVAQGAQYEGMVVNFMEYLFGGGGQLINEEGTESLLLEGDAGRQALEFMATSQAEGFYAPGFNTMQENEAVAEFQAGNAACMRNWPSFYAQLVGEGEEAAASEVQDSTGVTVLPTFVGEGTTGVTGGFNIGVNAFSDNVEAAQEFAIWAGTNEEVQLLLAGGSLPPVIESVYDQLPEEDPTLGLVGEILADEKTGSRPPAPTWNAISEAIQQNVYPAYNGELPIDEALNTLNEEINSQLGG
jgi:trehalose/maltose transport system substrate-binding protein